MNKIVWIFLLQFLLLPLLSFSQKDEIVKIGNSGEDKLLFDLYCQDVFLADPNARPDDLLSSYVDLRLKVLEAESIQLDTLKAIRSSVEFYRKQIFSDLLYHNLFRQLEQEAYRRLNEEIVAYQIFIPFFQKTDTLRAYGKAEEILKLSEQQSIEDIVKSYLRDKEVKVDPAPLRIKAFDLPYNLESALYDTPAGKVSVPVHTDRGYCLFGVIDRTKRLGKIKTAHILAAVTDKSSPDRKKVARMKINSVYEALRQGQSFDSLAVVFSDDSFSAPCGGELPPLNIEDMDTQYAAAVLSLAPGDSISKPVQTPFGWHIIQLQNCQEASLYEERSDEVKKRMELSGRTGELQKVRLDYLKNKYNVSLNIPLWNNLKLFRGDKIQLSQYAANIGAEEDPLFNYDDIPVFLSGFLTYVRESTYKGTPLNMVALFENYQLSVLENYDIRKDLAKDSLLRQKVKLFRDYLLAQEVTSRKILSDSITDETLNRYFKKNKSKYSAVEKQFGGVVVWCADKKVARRAKKLLKRWPEKGLKERMLKEFNTRSLQSVEIIDGIFSPGVNPEIDRAVFGLKREGYIPRFKKVLVRGKVVKGEKMPMETIRSQLRIDYIKELEKDWLHRLKVKYPVEIDKDVVKTVNNKS